MSRIRQRVLRAVRLLPEAVKIGIEPEPALPPVQEEEQNSNESQIAETSPCEAREGVKSVDAGDEPALKPGPDPELLQEIETLRASLGELEAENARLTEAKGKLESEIGDIRADYEKRKREIEAGAAEAAAKAAEEARARGHDEGWNAGRSEGFDTAQAEVKKEYSDRFSAAVSALEDFHRHLEENFSQLAALNQPRMIRMWSEMLRRMLRRQVELDPDTVFKVLADVLTRLSDKNKVVIYVSPEDIGLLEKSMESEFQEELRGVKHLEMNSDSHVDRGSCIVETGLGVYDARWRTQMGQIEAVVDNIFQQVTKQQVVREEAKDTTTEAPTPPFPEGGPLGGPVEEMERAAEQEPAAEPDAAGEAGK